MGIQIFQSVGLLILSLVIGPGVCRGDIQPLLPQTTATVSTVSIASPPAIADPAEPVAAPTPTAGESGLGLLIGLMVWRAIPATKKRANAGLR